MSRNLTPVFTVFMTPVFTCFHCFHVGNVAFQKGDNATALKYYSTAVEHAPQNYHAHSKVAVSLAYAHRYHEALAHAEMAKRLGWNQVPSLDYFIKSLKYQISQSGTGSQTGTSR